MSSNKGRARRNKNESANTTAVIGATTETESDVELEPGWNEGAARDPESVPGQLFATLALPIAEVEKGYRRRRIDLHLTELQADVLKRITEGLRGEPVDIDPKTGAWIRDGRGVDSPVRALRCILNMVAQQILASQNAVDGPSYVGELELGEPDVAGGSATSGDDLSDDDEAP